ncbi:VOC family protein [Pseudorhodoferax sp. Leaf265]|uniref:VOC family protein n=1 Tax=Pseudorhodoferax sp. Leaf265 TaxID=1736315 RepID=UPI001F2DFE70|nr:glyoxalase [Pseudorhodoferax sp. Leaf265]
MVNAAMDIQAINRVQLPFPPALASAVTHFYGELLGLTLMPQPPGPVLRFAARGQRVDLVATEQPAAAAPGLTPLSFEVQGLPQLRKRLLDAAFPLEENQPLPGYLRFFVHDPAGNRLEFVEPDVS